MTQTVSRDLADMLDHADLPWTTTRWGAAEITTPDDEYTIRVAEEDGTYYVTVLSGGRAMLTHTEARISGVAAQAVLLATLDALIAEFL